MCASAASSNGALPSANVNAGRKASAQAKRRGKGEREPPEWRSMRVRGHDEGARFDPRAARTAYAVAPPAIRRDRLYGGRWIDLRAGAARGDGQPGHQLAGINGTA